MLKSPRDFLETGGSETHIGVHNEDDRSFGLTYSHVVALSVSAILVVLDGSDILVQRVNLGKHLFMLSTVVIYDNDFQLAFIEVVVGIQRLQAVEDVLFGVVCDYNDRKFYHLFEVY